MPTPQGWTPPAGWVAAPWLIYPAAGGTTWMEQTGIGADGVDYSGQEVAGEFTRGTYGNAEVTTQSIPGGPVDPVEPEEPAEASELAQRVARSLGVPDDADVLALATEQTAIVEQFARAYTRGGGFTADGPGTDVAAVIVTAAARLVANPEQVERSIGDVAYRGGFVGWSLPELAVLNRYRRRAA